MVKFIFPLQYCFVLAIVKLGCGSWLYKIIRKIWNIVFFFNIYDFRLKNRDFAARHNVVVKGKIIISNFVTF